MTNLEKASELRERAEGLVKDGVPIEAAKCYALAARYYDRAFYGESAHYCEDKALWILKLECDRLSQNVVNTKMLADIIELSANIHEPDEDAYRSYT